MKKAIKKIMLKRAPMHIILILMLMLFSAPAVAQESGVNLIQNGSFEMLDGRGMPAHWYTEAWVEQEGFTEYGVMDAGRTGERGAFIYNWGMNDARFAQSISVEPNSIYKLAGYIKTESVLDSGLGANLSIGDIYIFSDGIYGTESTWQYVELYGKTGPEQYEIDVFVRLGGYSGESEGKAFFDDISLIKLEHEPTGVTVPNWYKQAQPVQGNTANNNSANEADPAWPLLIVIAVLYVLIAFGLLSYYKNRQGQNIFELSDQSDQNEQNGGGGNKRLYLFVFIAGALLAFIVRVIIGIKVPGYETDMGCFYVWGRDVFDRGPSGFYQPDYFCDYPPAYMLVLWLNGLVFNMLGPVSTSTHLLIVKFVPMVADIALACVLYVIARKKLPEIFAVIIGLCYAFNPIAIMNSAAWGQIDSILALGFVLVAYFAMKRKWQFVLPIYVFLVLAKPQALLIGPLGLVAIIVALVQNHNKKEIIKLLIGLLAAVILACLIIIPFTGEQPGDWLINLYGETLSSYNYAVLNTANLFYFFHGNWVGVEQSLPTIGIVTMILAGIAMLGLAMWLFIKRQMQGEAAPRDIWRKYIEPIASILCGILFILLGAFGASYGLTGYTLMALVIVYCLGLYIYKGKLSNLPLIGAVMLIGIYVFGPKMHERYLLPGIALLALAFIQKRDWRILILLLGLSATTFINVGIILDNSIRLGKSGGHLNNDTYGLNMILSVVNMALGGFSIYTANALCARENPAAMLIGKFKTSHNNVTDAHANTAHANIKERLLTPKDSRLGLIKKEYVVMIAVSLIYAVIAFWNLGSTKAPQTGWQSISSEEQIIFDLGEVNDFEMLYYGGVNFSDFSVSVSNDMLDWSEEYMVHFPQGECYKWKYVVETTGEGDDISYLETERIMHGRYVRLSAQSANLNIWEVLFRNENKEILPVSIVSQIVPDDRLENKKPAENLIDEQDVFEGEPLWYNSMYFDEIYHGRTAYEHAHGQSTYEWTHPPLGKVIMSWGVMIFGMTPFGWRFAGALIGVLMLPAMYLLAKQLLGKKSLATAAMLLMAFDLMHLTQTRIATIDSFPVFFIMLAYLCMLRFMKMDFHGTKLSKLLIPLGLSGLFMGLAIASKWIGIYAGLGLAVLFFWSCIRRLRECRQARALLAGGKKYGDRQEPLEISAKDTYHRLLVICAFCILFFIVVPLIIYYISYIPHFAHSGGVTLQKIWDEQIRMLKYHATPGLGMDHAFYSPWWEWPLIKRPMMFASTRRAPEGMSSAIFSMGNPAVWWTGLAALFIVFMVFAKRHLWFNGRGTIVHIEAKTKRTQDIAPAFLLLGFASQYMPWVLVPRGTYIYHYFASVPFIILCTVLLIGWLIEKWPKFGKIVLWSLVALAGLLFIGFYPYASGMTVSVQWLDFMKWLPRIYYFV